MDNEIKTLIKLEEFSQKELLSSTIKKLVLDEENFDLTVACSDTFFVLFSNYSKIKQFKEGEDEKSFELIISKEELSHSDKILYISHDDNTRAYLCVLDDSKDQNDLLSKISFTVSIVSKLFENEVKGKIASKSLLPFFETEQLKTFSDGEMDIEEIMKIHTPLIFISQNDFNIFQKSLKAFIALYSVEKEKKSTFFSEIGKMFFRNYTSHPENMTLDDYLSPYEIILSDSQVLMNVRQEKNMGIYYGMLDVAKKIKPLIIK